VNACDDSNADAQYKWQDDKKNARSCQTFRERHMQSDEQQAQLRLLQAQVAELYGSFELARVPMHFDHVVSVIVNAVTQRSRWLHS
jgi:hypothetical protein